MRGENGPAFAGLEMLDTRIEGTVLVVVARLSVNLNALTIEQAPAPLALPIDHSALLRGCGRRRAWASGDWQAEEAASGHGLGHAD